MNIWSAGNYIFETDYGKGKTKAEQPHTMNAARNVVWFWSVLFWSVMFGALVLAHNDDFQNWLFFISQNVQFKRN